MSASEKQNLQSSAVIGKLFDLTERRVQQLAKEGILPAASVKPYRFDLLITVKSYIKYLSDKANGKETKTADTLKAESNKLKAEAELKQTKAKISSMQLKELEGKMHRSEDVEAVMNDLVYTVRSMIIALPGRLAMDVMQATNANEASVIIRTECNKILEDLANYQYDPETYRRRVRDREGWGNIIVDETDD